ncbi:hypothetical protein [Streptomyces sp. S.PB5]|uniref:hypothetical protein n=1 Tax=Streptomyces sp. S.PB5 TaxID=3020844 RepID=UPI0025B15A45|nr:hypothetical protein [Streptomyces sp. S.PB5]MDN3027926.1 hypothetical protein [Streptomyces sp. S.PB5]
MISPWPAANGARPDPSEAAARRRWAVRSLDLAAVRLSTRPPRLPVDTRVLGTPPGEALLTAGVNAGPLVPGSRGLGTTSASLLGSTSARTAAVADFPLTLVRPPESHPGEPAPDGPVLLTLDAGHGHNSLAAAVRRPPRVRRAGRLLTEVLTPWRQKIPEVRVEEVCLEDVPACAVPTAGGHAALVALGHRVASGDTPRLGAVAHAAVRRATSPVLSVPYG